MQIPLDNYQVRGSCSCTLLLYTNPTTIKDPSRMDDLYDLWSYGNYVFWSTLYDYDEMPHPVGPTHRQLS